MHVVDTCKNEEDPVRLITGLDVNHRIRSYVTVKYLLILSVTYGSLILRGVFQKYAERFHRMFAIAARLMIFHVKHAW